MKDHFVVDKSGLAKSYIIEAVGHTLLDETGLRVKPMTGFPVTEVNDNIYKLLCQHRIQTGGEKVSTQHQVLKSVPITVVTFRSPGRRVSKFYIYGCDRKIHYENSNHNCISK